MSYKDKDKQREANRKAQARFKAKAKGITRPGITLPEHTDLGNTLTTTQTGSASNAKRGKDIKCFEDLHPEIQANIRTISDTDEEFERRTANAIHYQHLFPDRYEPRSVPLPKVE